MQKKFKRSFDSLNGIFEFTERFYSAESVDASLRFAVDLAVEELFTNIVKYNTGSTGEVLVSLERAADRIVGCLSDYGVEPFDVTRVAEVDTDSPLAERRVGGLGLHLVRRVTDTLDYDYRDGCSTITFTKQMG